MNKGDRKKLETSLLSAVEAILHPKHQQATKKIRKFLKGQSKDIAKKFTKAVNKVNKEIAAKKKEIASKIKAPVKKVAVAKKK
ncbi:MAG TPA: hypothetical protein PLU53_00510 [Bacteroidia bacterium]|nr:hypothetical protein [Bacteroidia bacterium]